MSGVIDEFGQWEHCHSCGEFVLIQHLRYEKPSEAHPYGRDLCAKCCSPNDPLQQPHRYRMVRQRGRNVLMRVEASDAVD